MQKIKQTNNTTLYQTYVQIAAEVQWACWEKPLEKNSGEGEEIFELDLQERVWV